MEVRSETRTSDTEVDERLIQKAVQKNENNEDQIGIEVDGSNASAADEEEEDKTVTDIEIVDEIVETSGIVLNDAVVECNGLDDNSNNVSNVLKADAS